SKVSAGDSKRADRTGALLGLYLAAWARFASGCGRIESRRTSCRLRDTADEYTDDNHSHESGRSNRKGRCLGNCATRGSSEIRDSFPEVGERPGRKAIFV